MKMEFTERPELVEESYGFSWMEFVLAIPSLLVNVTTYKPNGLANASMQSWCTFVGENGYHVLLGSVNKYGHLYASARETGCCVVNIPSQEVFGRCMDTINHNAPEDDEIAAAGLTQVKASRVGAPMIAECMVNLECELEWEHDITEGGYSSVMCFRVVNVWAEDSVFDETNGGRYGENGYLYNIHSPVHPLTGESLGTSVGTIKRHKPYS